MNSPCARKWPQNERRSPTPRSRETTLPIVRDNYRINKFTSCWNAYNISTSAKWYRDTVVYHRASYRPLPVTHCTVYVVSSDAFGSYPLFLYGAYRASFENPWHFKETRTLVDREPRRIRNARARVHCAGQRSGLFEDPHSSLNITRCLCRVLRSLLRLPILQFGRFFIFALLLCCAVWYRLLNS